MNKNIKNGEPEYLNGIILYVKVVVKKNIQTYDDTKSCEQLWNVNNGITYCIDCHMEEDKMRAKFRIINPDGGVC